MMLIDLNKINMKRIIMIHFVWVVLFACKTSPDKSFNLESRTFIYIGVIHPSFESLLPKDRIDLIGQKFSEQENLELLSASDAAKFHDRFLSDKSYNWNSAICWLPQISFYCVEKGKVVNYIEVSLDCNRIQSTVEFERLESQDTGGVYLHRGLTHQFRLFIRTLLTTYFDDKFAKIPRYDDHTR